LEAASIKIHPNACVMLEHQISLPEEFPLFSPRLSEKFWMNKFSNLKVEAILVSLKKLEPNFPPTNQYIEGKQLN
jgi:hypothetical protein